jgi:hypothetical protein
MRHSWQNLEPEGVSSERACFVLSLLRVIKELLASDSIGSR